MVHIFTAHVYDNTHGKHEMVGGIVHAKNFTEAMKEIEGYYGDELISVSVFAHEADNLIELPTDICVQLMR